MSKITRIQEYLIEQDLELAVISHPTSIHYLTGFACDPHERQLFLFIFRNKVPLLFVPSLEVNRASDEVSLDILGYLDAENPWQILKDTGYFENLTKVTVEFDHLTLDKYMGLGAFLPHVLENISPFINEMKLIKSPDEVTKLKIAGEWADKAIQIGIASVALSKTEDDIITEIEFAMKKAGITKMSFDTMVLTGTNAADPHGIPGQHPIENNALLLFDLGVATNGYMSDITRTIAVGEPTDFQKEIYALCLEAQEAAIAMIKPGVTAHEVDLAARSVIDAAGYGKYFNHRLGHGIGMEVHEFPSIMAGNDMIIQEGMCFSVEPGIYIPGKVGVRIEDCGVVTANGFDLFTHTSKSLLSILG